MAKTKRKKKRAKVEVLAVTRLEPTKHFVGLEVSHAEEPPAKELSTWSRVSKWMGLS